MTARKTRRTTRTAMIPKMYTSFRGELSFARLTANSIFLIDRILLMNCFFLSRCIFFSSVFDAKSSELTKGYFCKNIRTSIQDISEYIFTDIQNWCKRPCDNIFIYIICEYTTFIVKKVTMEAFERLALIIGQR